MQDVVRPFIDETLGDDILERLQTANNGMPFALVLIAIPLVEGGQPGFVTNLQAKDMEHLIRDMGAHFTEEFCASRVDGVPPEYRN